MKDIIKLKKGLDILIESSYKANNINESKLIFEELSKDRDLQVLYFCVNNLQNPPLMTENEINDFIDENVKLSQNINLKLLKECANSTELELSEMDKAIGMVLFETRNAINFVDYNNARKLIYENILGKIKKPNINLNEFPEEDVQFVKEYIENPENKYKQICTECIEILDKKLLEENIDNDTKVLIYETKSKILENQINCKYNPENVIDILNLKKNLIN